MKFRAIQAAAIAVLMVVMGAALLLAQTGGNTPTGGNTVAGPQVNPSAGVAQQCSGSGTLSAGNLQLTADCMGGYSKCAAVPVGVGTPRASGGDTVMCGPTTAVTGSPQATHTVVILNAPTANATPGVAWWGIF